MGHLPYHSNRIAKSTFIDILIHAYTDMANTFPFLYAVVFNYLPQPTLQPTNSPPQLVTLGTHMFNNCEEFQQFLQGDGKDTCLRLFNIQYGVWEVQYSDTSDSEDSLLSNYSDFGKLLSHNLS